jgi:endoribonuclease Dicer
MHKNVVILFYSSLSFLPALTKACDLFFPRPLFLNLFAHLTVSCTGNEPYIEEQPNYFPPELVGCLPKNTQIMYHCYLIELKQNFDYDVPVHDIVLVMRSELDSDLGSMHFDLDVDRGSLAVNFKYVGVNHLSPDLVTSLLFFTLLTLLI